MDFSDSSGELPLSRLCSPNRTSASCPSLPRYQAACVSILCGSARAVARVTCAADSGGGTRERISLRPPDPHSHWHDAITQQSGRFTGEPEVTELLPVCRPYRHWPHLRRRGSRGRVSSSVPQINPVADSCARVQFDRLRVIQPLKRCLVTDCAVFTAHDARSHARRTSSRASEGRTNRKRGDRCAALLNTRLPKELIQILVSPDALGVASGRESRIRYNSVDVIAGLAY